MPERVGQPLHGLHAWASDGAGHLLRVRGGDAAGDLGRQAVNFVHEDTSRQAAFAVRAAHASLAAGKAGGRAPATTPGHQVSVYTASVAKDIAHANTSVSPISVRYSLRTAGSPLLPAGVDAPDRLRRSLRTDLAGHSLPYPASPGTFAAQSAQRPWRAKCFGAIVNP